VAALAPPPAAGGAPAEAADESGGRDLVSSLIDQLVRAELELSS